MSDVAFTWINLSPQVPFKNVLSFQWLPILVSFNHLLITVNCSFNFLFYWSYCRGTGVTNGKWKCIPYWAFDLLIRAPGMSKLWWGPENQMSSLVQIKNPHFFHFQIAFSKVDINQLNWMKQKFHITWPWVSEAIEWMYIEVWIIMLDGNKTEISHHPMTATF